MQEHSIENKPEASQENVEEKVKEPIKEDALNKELMEKEQEKDSSRPISSTAVSGTPWCVVWTGDGRAFFFNPSQRTSVWETPDELKGRADVDKLLERPPNDKPVETIADNTNDKKIQNDTEVPQEAFDEPEDPPPKRMKS